MIPRWVLSPKQASDGLCSQASSLEDRIRFPGDWKMMMVDSALEEDMQTLMTQHFLTGLREHFGVPSRPGAWGQSLASFSMFFCQLSSHQEAQGCGGDVWNACVTWREGGIKGGTLLTSESAQEAPYTNRPHCACTG